MVSVGIYGGINILSRAIQSLTMSLLVVLLSNLWSTGNKKNKAFIVGVSVFSLFAYPRFLFTGAEINFLKGTAEAFLSALIFLI